VLGIDPPADATFGPPSPGDGAAIAPLWDDMALDQAGARRHPCPPETPIDVWDDMALDQAGARICTYPTGNRFVVQWLNAYRVNHLGQPNNRMRLTFELVLDFNTHSVDFIYQTLTPTTGPDLVFANGLDARVGVQAPFGSDWTIHSGRVSTSEGIRFSP